MPSGERLEGHCPFHPFDETPSFNLYVISQRYHCFGCGADGDVIDFVQAFDVCSFQEALHRLSGNIMVHCQRHSSHDTRSTRPVLPVSLSLARGNGKAWRTLLTEAQQSYHQTLLEHPTLKEDLRQARGNYQRGIERCQLGYVDGSLLPALLTAEKRDLAETIGLLSITGQERLYGVWSFLNISMTSVPG